MDIKQAASGCLLLFFAAYACGAQKAAGDSMLEQRVARIEKLVGRLPRVSGFVNMRYQFDKDCHEQANTCKSRRGDKHDANVLAVGSSLPNSEIE